MIRLTVGEIKGIFFSFKNLLAYFEQRKNIVDANFRKAGYGL